MNHICRLDNNLILGILLINYKYKVADMDYAACCEAAVFAEGTGSEVNSRVDKPLALTSLALPRVCLFPS